jgi:hypothetical protein
MDTPTEDWLADLHEDRIHRLMGVFTGGERPRILLETVDPMYALWVEDLDGYITTRDLLIELEPDIVRDFDRSELRYLVAHDTMGPGATRQRYVDLVTTDEGLARSITDRIGGGIFGRGQLLTDDPPGCAEALSLWEAADDSRYAAWNRRRRVDVLGEA